ncbi:hypothetical protein SLEP1_g24717 [Rubroshorea leprosula]|uniref:Reverse transcriptase domain-containing protein n=1 Tax=Rubroshorea leprosula TaxID=152421 RepID=A0AAV5JGJ1_9ROSI|nr:hypothetical protein SLEP1_g24717 [Rubroshorea leprosula]
MASTRVRARGDATWGSGSFRRWQGYNRRIGEYGHWRKGQVELFFFYNFPENWDAKDMWHRFQECGKVADVFVLGKRDRWGKRFGFVRMEGVKDVKQVEERLNRIWLGSYKLRVRIAADRGPQRLGTRRNVGVKAKSREQKYVQPGKSYVEAVEPETCGVRGSVDKMGSVMVENNREEIIEFSPLYEEKQWLEGSVVAVVRSMTVISSIQERIDVDGGLINISPLGGRSLLLTERSKGFLSEYLHQNKVLFDLWCEAIHPWALAPQQGARMVWLRISGVSLKAWCDRCFEKIASHVGEVHKISKTFKLKVEDEMYEIRLSKEEWRVDLDWWLADEDCRGTLEPESETESEYSLSVKGEEDHVFKCAEICGVDEDGIDEERLHKEGILNSNLDVEQAGKEVVREEENGLNGPGVEMGLLEASREGLEAEMALEPWVYGLAVQEIGQMRDALQSAFRKRGEVSGKAQNELKSAVSLGIRDSREKRRKAIKDCYPQDQAANCEEGILRGTSRTKLWTPQQLQQVVTMPARRSGSSSLSDGCIAHRNQGNEEEVQSRLMEMEARDEGQGREGSVEKEGGGKDGEWGPKKMKCNFVNVYAPTDKRKKVKLWAELRQRIMDEEGRWLIVGDFNAVRCIEERKGRTGESLDMKEFDDFVVSTGLVDLKLANRRFTWYMPDGSAMSRLDRALLSVEMCNIGEEWVQQGLKRTVSDHCPIMVKTMVVDWGPKPFRVLDAWQQHPQFKKVVEDKWKELNVDGYAGYRCKQKLKSLKEFLKGWNKEVFGNMETEFQRVAHKVDQIDMKNEMMDLEDREVDQRKEGFEEIWDILRKREAIWKQKSRSEWVKLGDQNSRYFHKIANGRKAQNSISGLLCAGRWVEEPDMVKKEVVNFFRKLFQEEHWNRPKPTNLVFKRIFDEQRMWLERPFSDVEIEEGLKNCAGGKAPGPDGYNFNFLKLFWNSIKEDFVSFFREFHQHSRLVRGLNSSFLALIPKKLSPKELKDFRPISLIGCVYKLLAKVLANRLKVVMPEIIGEAQSAFVGGRQLVDSALVLNEVVDEVRMRKKLAFIYKADFQKAYDCVNWSFLDGMMDGFGFGAKWRGWIMKCLSTARFSVLVNGSSTEEIDMEKGLRQGDPLSPFLFLMVVEGLNGLVKTLENEGLLHGIEVGKRGLTVSLLQFADDTVFLGMADSGNITMVKTILRWFELMSGLRLNFNKSSLYRLGDGREGLWKRVVKDKYYDGEGEVGMIDVDTVRVSKIWGDIICVGGQSTKLKNMLVKGFRWKVGDGSRVGFWRDVWVGNKSLRDLFPRLFQLAEYKESKVKENGSWERDSWNWELKWWRERRRREQDEEKKFWEVLGSVQLRHSEVDTWQWAYDVGAIKSKFFWVEDVSRQAANKMEFAKERDAWSVWVKVIRWWGLEVVMPDKWQNNPVECAKELTRYKKSLKIFKQQQGRCLQPDSPEAET